jgi:ABC-type cobalamin/Fe3+-siderophores transport system ATPase subunit
MDILKSAEAIKTRLIGLQKVREITLKQRKEMQDRLNKNYHDLEIYSKARVISQTVAENTQKQLEYHISHLVTMALSSVFPAPYEFKLSFVQKRNKTEAKLLFLKNGNESDDILNTGGGGVSDVASLALRISLWSINKTRPVLLLDEPMKFLHSPEYQEKASQMIKEVCEKLGLQIIMISDQKDILKYADNVIEIKNINGVSIVSKPEEKIEEQEVKIIRRRKK